MRGRILLENLVKRSVFTVVFSMKSEVATIGLKMYNILISRRNSDWEFQWKYSQLRSYSSLYPFSVPFPISVWPIVSNSSRYFAHCMIFARESCKIYVMPDTKFTHVFPPIIFREFLPWYSNKVLREILVGYTKYVRQRQIINR